MELLRHAKKLGAATLGELTRTALTRLLTSPRPRARQRLFDADERDKLAKMLAATNATAELLGRARIRRRQEQAERHYDGKSGSMTENVAAFSESPTDFSCFDEEAGLQPLAPRSAIDYFRRLVPRLNIDPARFADTHEREAFTLAEATEQTLLERIQGILGDVLATGQGVSATPRLIDQLLDRAGVSPRNPQYAEMVTRTNLMDSYTTGTMREMQDPDVKEAFPAWRYLGIRDGRQGHDHEPHFYKYFANGTDFAEVRDSLIVKDGQIVPSGGKGRPFNCRCNPQPIYKSEWAELQARGAALSTFTERFVPDYRQTTDSSCGAGALRAVLATFDIHKTETEIRAAVGTTAEGGTLPERIVAAARRWGLSALPRHAMLMEDLAAATRAGQLVIVPIQSGGTAGSRANEENGHWVVVLGVDADGVRVQDPAEGRRTLACGEFEQDWHDEDGDGERFARFGIVLGQG